MPFVVSLLVEAGGGETRKIQVNLPARPYPGEILELPDGTQIIAESIEHSLEAGIDAEVRARPAS